MKTSARPLLVLACCLCLSRSEPARGGQTNDATAYSFTTIAGNAGYGTADGTGDAARFKGPQGIALDYTGRLYVADSDNYTIRMLTSRVVAERRLWTASTIAGLAGERGSADGTGSAARFSRMKAIAVDRAGNLYVTDTDNHTIRQVRPLLAGERTNWIVTTIAGQAGSRGGADGAGSAARFNRPAGITLDSAGNLYVADNGNGTIRQLARPAAGQSEWIVTTIAGMAGHPGTADGTDTTARFMNPFGIAADNGGHLYVTDYGSCTIRKLTRTSDGQMHWKVETIAGAPGNFGSADGTNDTAQFYNPFGITVDHAGNLYVTDSGNNLMRQIRPRLSTGQTNWIVSTIAGLLDNPGANDGFGDDALFSYPNDVAVDHAGNLYVADTFNNTVRQMTSGLFAGRVQWKVTTIAGAAGGNGSDDGEGSAARFDNPNGLAVDGSGNVYVADNGNCAIRELTPSDMTGRSFTVSTIAGLAGIPGSEDGSGSAAQFDSPEGIALDSTGALFVADTGNNLIRLLKPQIAPGRTAWVTTTIAGMAGNPGSADGVGSAAQFNKPGGLVTDAAGSLFVADYGNHTIRKITPVRAERVIEWTVTTVAGLAGTPGNADGTGNAARFNGPHGIAVDRAGNLFVADTGNSLIRKLSPVVSSGETNWVVTTIAGLAGKLGNADGPGPAARFSIPSGIGADQAGNLFVADYGNDSIRKLSLTQSEGHTVWVASTVAGCSGKPGSTDGSGSAARFNGPSALAVDRDGRVYVADSANCTIRRGTNSLRNTTADSTAESPGSRSPMGR